MSSISIFLFQTQIFYQIAVLNLPIGSKPVISAVARLKNGNLPMTSHIETPHITFTEFDPLSFSQISSFQFSPTGALLFDAISMCKIGWAPIFFTLEGA